MSLIERIQDEINSDDEDPQEQSLRLIRLHLAASPETRAVLDDAFICLCGYSLTTLIGKPQILSIALASDLADLVAWAVDHASAETTEWLDSLNPEANSYPWQVQIPAELVDDVRALLDDWQEVLSSHPEDKTPFLTRIVEDETGELALQ